MTTTPTWSRPSTAASLVVELLASGIDALTLGTLDVETATLTAQAVRIRARQRGLDVLTYTFPLTGDVAGVYQVAAHVIERPR